MTSAVTSLAVVSADDPVQTALDDSELRSGLLNHALALMRKRLAGRSAAERNNVANEAFQEVCVRALERRQEYNPEMPVRPWLHGIMTIVILETVRTVLRLPAQELADASAWEKLAVDLTPDITETVPTRLDAANYLVKLPAEYQEVVRLRYYEGLSHDGIAARLGISRGNARVRLCRALSALRAIAGSTTKEAGHEPY